MSPRLVRRVPVGAEVQPDGGTHFRVWAPDPATVAVHVEPLDGRSRVIALEREDGGYCSAWVPECSAGDRYWYVLDGERAADPASRFQPEGPHGPSQVVDPLRFRWTDQAWRGPTRRGQIISEIHIGTFTREGTWPAAMVRLSDLARTGITAVEVMPVSEFPGRFGWGYDGVFPYAPTRLYGTPDDLRAFVDRAHQLGIAVILDVVYNHLGPAGCVFSRYAQAYFTSRYENEWGEALNFDGPGSDAVREYFASNAAYWVDEFHLDGLRLDATQSLHDASDEHIIAEVTRRARGAASGRRVLVIAENEPQHVRIVRPVEEGGYGADALWNDDFHHSALVAVTGRREAYYTDHHGRPQEFISAAKYGYLFQGQRYAWQKRNRGTSARGIAPDAFVNYIENHDQLANAGDGSRLHARTSPGRYRALTALLLLLPGTPMLFQGQEFGASSPFLFFADHDPALAEAVRNGRAAFVAQFPSLAAPDAQRRLDAPHDPATFERCRLNWDERRTRDSHVRLHRDLIALRRTDEAFRLQRPWVVDGAVLDAEAFLLRYVTPAPHDERLLVVNFGRDFAAPSVAEPLAAPPDGFEWTVRWSSEHPDYGGLGTPEIVGACGWYVPGQSAIVLRPEAVDGSH